MDHEWTAWALKWALTAGLTGVAVVLRALFVRVRSLESSHAAIEARLAAGGDSRVEPLRQELQALRLEVAQSYVRRDDYVTQVSEVLGRLDGIGTIVTRVEERQKAHERLHELRAD